MDSLPFEMWHYIFSFLTSNDILNSRTVCKKWNTISLATFKWSKLNIGFRNDEDVVEFCEMMKQSGGGLNFCNFFIKFEDHSFSTFNLTELSKEIGSYATSYYFSFDYCYCMSSSNILHRCIRYDMINIMLNATPNLRMLFVYTELEFPEPNFHPLEQLEELHLKTKRFHKNDVELKIVTNWIKKAPSLKKFHSNFESTFQNSGEMSQYFQLLKEIPEVCMYVCLPQSQNYERHLEELQSVKITEFHLEIRNGDKEDQIRSAIYLLLEKQSGHLRTLRIGTISGITNFTLPFLPKLTTFETINSGDDREDVNFSLFDPRNIPCLQKLSLDCELSTIPLQNPFIGAEYSTVTKLILWAYSKQDWRKMFPRLKKMTICLSNLDLLKHLLDNPPADYLMLQMSMPELIDYLIANPSSVPKIGVNLNHSNKFIPLDTPTEFKIKLWNTITGYAWIESESILSIKGINDIQVPHETGTKPSIADIKNLWKLRLFGSEEVLKGIAYLFQKEVSFSSLKKFTLNESIKRKELYANLRKLPTWNLNLETMYFETLLPAFAITFSQKKIPEHLLDNILNRSKKYATLIL